MKVTSVSIVRGTAQPGIEVTFRGEGSDSVEVHLKDDGLVTMSDKQIYARAKRVLAMIGEIEDRTADTRDGGSRAGGGIEGTAKSRSSDPVPIGMMHPADTEIFGGRNAAAADDLAAIRAQIAELRETVSKLSKASLRLAENHPLATVAIVSLGLWALAGLTTRRVFRGRR